MERLPGAAPPRAGSRRAPRGRCPRTSPASAWPRPTGGDALEEVGGEADYHIGSEEDADVDLVSGLGTPDLALQPSGRLPAQRRRRRPDPQGPIHPRTCTPPARVPPPAAVSPPGRPGPSPAPRPQSGCLRRHPALPASESRRAPLASPGRRGTALLPRAARRKGWARRAGPGRGGYLGKAGPARPCDSIPPPPPLEGWVAPPGHRLAMACAVT